MLTLFSFLMTEAEKLRVGPIKMLIFYLTEPSCLVDIKSCSFIIIIIIIIIIIYSFIKSVVKRN